MRTVHFPVDASGRGPVVHHVVLANQPTHTACEEPAADLLEGTAGLRPCPNCLYTVMDGTKWAAYVIPG